MSGHPGALLGRLGSLLGRLGPTKVANMAPSGFPKRKQIRSKTDPKVVQFLDASWNRLVIDLLSMFCRLLADPLVDYLSLFCRFFRVGALICCGFGAMLETNLGWNENQ